MDGSAQTAFLSTLAQVTATLLGIFAAAIAAFYVFLNERQSVYDARIEDQIQVIRTTLLDLRTTWQWSHRFMLPRNFAQSYRSLHADKARPEFVALAAVDLMMAAPKLTGELEKSARSAGDSLNHWQGRVFFWLLTEAVTELVGSGPPTEPQLDAIFPASVTGPGFDEWRANYSRTLQGLATLTFAPDGFVRDFDEYIKQNSGSRFPPDYSKASLQRVLEAKARVNGSIREIDKQAALRERYSPSIRLHGQWLLTLGLLAFVVGTVIPLLLVTWVRQVSSVGAATLLLVSLGATLGAVSVLVLDVVRPPRSGRSEYLAQRWYRPLLERVVSATKRVDDFGMLDLEFEMEASVAATSGKLEPRVAQALTGYLQAGQTYNAAAAGLFDLFLGAVHSNPVLLALNPTQMSSGQSAGLELGNFLVPSGLDRPLAVLRQTPQNLSVELQFPKWRTVVLAVPKGALEVSLNGIEEAFRQVAGIVQASDLRQGADVAGASVREASAVLKRALEAASG